MVRALIRDLRAVVSPGADLLAGVGAFLAPMAVIGFEPHMGGDTIMFIAANIGYMWGLALGIVSILPSAVVPAGAECRPRLGFVDSGGAVMCSKHSP